MREVSMRSLAMIIVIFMTACGGEPDIDPRLQQYLDLYLDNAPNNGHLDRLVSFKIDPFMNHHVGYCDKDATKVGGKRISSEYKITIRPMISIQQERVTAIHELAHCLHDIEHSNGKGYDIMDKGFAGEDAYWAEHFDEKFAELMAQIAQTRG
jgi:hypothetical protein